jgi:hypothetical protein
MACYGDSFLVGLERGPLSLIEYNWGATWKKGSEYDYRDPLCWPRNTLYSQKLALTTAKSGGCSIGIVHSQTKAMEFVWCLHLGILIIDQKYEKNMLK